MKTITALTIILSLGIYSCKSTSQTKSTTATIHKEEQTATAETMEDKVYDIIIAFISKGEGIDQELKAKVDLTIENFNKKNKTTLKPEILGWGREGEKDYNIILKNLSTKQKKAFISSIEAIVSGTDMAHITFNQKSVHKR